ncbi:MAG: dihydroorotase [Candidatus Alcyoniella australis]|nr:dihydroorotase [Candidatus Alcyoniella australis]
MKLLIKGGRVIDPAQGIDKPLDVLIEKGRIASLIQPASRVRPAMDKVKTIDATGCIVAPGLIDMHVHFREPGFEHKETIESGCAAAAAGGFTSVCCMANTNPVNDNQAITLMIIAQAQKANGVRVYPIAAATVGQNGEAATEIGELKTAGAVALSDDGNEIRNSQVARLVLEYASMFDMPVILHCEDMYLSQGGQVNEGFVSTELGLPGIPNAAEESMVARNLILAEMTGAPIHIAHVSTAGSVDLIRWAKARDVRVTAEATPHHLTLTEKAVRGYNTQCKMSPPLRSEQDRIAVLTGLADGTIDAVATDHAPHDDRLKIVEFDKAANGVIGLETALGLMLRLVRQGQLDLPTLIQRMSTAPARIMGLPGGSLAVDQPADVVVFDPEQEWTVDAMCLRSRSHNTPFDGWSLPGVIKATIVNGRIVHSG